MFSTLKRLLDDDDEAEQLTLGSILLDDELDDAVVKSKKLVSVAAFACLYIRIRSSNNLYYYLFKRILKNFFL